LYNSSASSSYIPNGTHINFNYGSGSVVGHLSIDTLSIGGVLVSNQTFAEVTNGTGFSGAKFDGLFGFAYPSLSGGVTQPFQNMIQQGIVSPAVFSFWLNS
jgi:cathepsin D